jgi:transposase
MTRPRSRQLWSGSIPSPGYCAAPAENRTARDERCGADLTTAKALTFDAEHHGVLSAQRRINEIITADLINSGVYAGDPQSPASVLADIRAIAIRALTYASPSELEPIIGTDLLTAYQQDHPHLPTARNRSPTKKLAFQVPEAVSLTAAGVIAALHCLEQPDVPTAGQSLRWLITAMRSRRAHPCTTHLLWTGGVSGAVQLAALGPSLKPSDQLRYRTVSSWPAIPKRNLADLDEQIDQLPTSLWQNVALRLSIPGSHLRQLRPALSVAVLLVNTKTKLGPLTRRLDSPFDDHAVSRVLQLLNKHPDWTDISKAIDALADNLATATVPIDYSRRRRLNYDNLLPDATWQRICRETGATSRGPARAQVARLYLQERISGTAIGRHDISPDLRTKIADFPYYLTPRLSYAFDDYALEFLAGQGVRAEPVHYEPNTDFLDGLCLPGRNPADIDIAALHRSIQNGLSLGHAAEHAGADLDTARYLLACYPTPFATTDLNAYRRAKEAYPREAFIERYELCGMSLAEIADQAGVSRQTVARLAADYQIETRKPGRATKYTIDPDWLYTQYVDHQRPLPDLARERGVSTTTMARWAKTYGVPLRPRGGARNSAKVAT